MMLVVGCKCLWALTYVARSVAARTPQLVCITHFICTDGSIPAILCEWANEWASVSANQTQLIRHKWKKKKKNVKITKITNIEHTKKQKSQDTLRFDIVRHRLVCVSVSVAAQIDGKSRQSSHMRPKQSETNT